MQTTIGHPRARSHAHLPIVIGVFTAGFIGFLVFSRLVGTSLPLAQNLLILASLAALSASGLAGWRYTRRAAVELGWEMAGIVILAVTSITLALAAVYQMSFYVALPVDLLSFAESPFIDKVLRLRLGAPLYTPPQENISYPYTPGAEMLTYAIASLFGHGDSIPALRTVQFFYVLFAAGAAAGICELLARRFLSEGEFRYRPVWRLVWFGLAVLFVFDPRFNLYNHSLHNDGLALFISLCAYWLMLKHAQAPRTWHVIAMILLPGLGFWVKQSLLIWIAIFAFYFIAAGSLSWKKVMVYLAASGAFLAGLVFTAYLVWGEPFNYWIFQALGQKQGSILRIALHAFDAGIYIVLGLWGGWYLALRRPQRTGLVLWAAWLLLIGIEIYTSGISFQRNHLGPGIVIAACWGLAALVRAWFAQPASGETFWISRTREAFLFASVILLVGALGLVREPLNPVPPDFNRYAADIEAVFEGQDPARILMDTGSWVYLENSVLMQDRSAPVSLHVGSNQPEIGRHMLQETIQRIEGRAYDRILARQLDTGDTWYDFQDRGSGVKAAILANYHVVAHIPAVSGIRDWWPRHLVEEIVVLAPNDQVIGEEGR